MSPKQLMPNQCVPLHFIYGAHDCCLCNARKEATTDLQDLARAIYERVASMPELIGKGDFTKGYRKHESDVLAAIRSVCTEHGIELDTGEKVVDTGSKKVVTLANDPSSDD